MPVIQIYVKNDLFVDFIKQDDDQQKKIRDKMILTLKSELGK